MSKPDSIPQLPLSFHPDLPLTVSFDAPETSSDGGWLLLRQIDDQLGVTRTLAARMPDRRDPERVEHDRHEQLRQRVYQIALGYEDCNDADRLRHDPVLKTVCNRTPQSRLGLSSQPTLSRFENAITARGLNAMIDDFEQSYVDALPVDTHQVVLDIDPTDDETHGHQQLSFFHGFYDQHMYHPLLVFDDQGQLVSVLLRPGNAHAARSAKIVLCRLIRRIKARFPAAQITVRADSGFCVPRILDQLEQLDRELGDIEYVIGIAKNPRLRAQAQPAIEEAQRRFEQTGRHVRHFASIRYAAHTWSRERHVVVKAEHHAKGPNPRFVVTTLDQFSPQLLYDVGYCARGQCENFIKDFKNALAADRLSCGRYLANCFRLLLHAAAYRLMYALRNAARSVAPVLGLAQFDTLRLRLLKVAAHVVQSVRRLLVRLPRAFPYADAFRALALALAAPPAPS
jgi:hypothetical protein